MTCSNGDADALVVDGTYPRVDGRLARSGSACPVYCAAMDIRTAICSDFLPGTAWDYGSAHVRT